MAKYLFTVFALLTVASFGMVDTHLADGSATYGQLEPLKTVFAPDNSGKDDVYTDQVYVGGATVDNGVSIYDGAGYESADDYTPATNVTINVFKVWILSDASPAQVDMRVDIFSDSTGPASAPPGDVFNETVAAGACTWVDTGYYAFTRIIYEVTIPTSDVNLTGGDTYWIGMQSDGANGNVFWCAFNYLYGSEMYFYYTTYWTAGHNVFTSYYDTFFGLYYEGVGIESASVGTIKANFAE